MHINMYFSNFELHTVQSILWFVMCISQCLYDCVSIIFI